MRIKLGLLVLVAVLATCAQSNGATTNPRRLDTDGPRRHARVKVSEDPRLNAVASTIAGHPVTVGCYAPDEFGSPASMGAWGYVYIGGDYEFMDEQVCQGALAIVTHDPRVPWWRQAVGALVLTHESFHLSLTAPDPGNEARTECRAVNNAGQTIRKLGGNDLLVGVLMPYVLAVHWRVAARYRAYYMEGCKGPWWWK